VTVRPADPRRWSALADACVAALRAPGSSVRIEEPLGPQTTYRVGGPARLLAEVDSVDDLVALARVLASDAVPVLMVGRGSNLLVADTGFDGVAVVLGPTFADVAVAGSTVVAGGSALLPVVARRTAAAGLRGFEWAVGVPGTVGGAVRMNAGGHGADLAEALRDVVVEDPARAEARPVHRPPASLELGYRRSTLRPSEAVVQVTLELRAGAVGDAEAAIGEIVAWRRENQPGGPNAGSVFANPIGDSAGRLIDAAGGRGMRVGSAEVSRKHANFIQADSGGSAGDVWALMDAVRRLVVASGGPLLEPETVLVGLPPLPEVDR